MSLISDALKKAQRQRTEGTEDPAATPVESGAQGPRVARREKPAGFRSQMLMLAGGGLAVVVIAVAVGGVWFWRSGHKAEPLPLKQEAAVSQSATPTATPPAGAATSAPASAATSAPASTATNVSATATPAPASAAPVVEPKPTPTRTVETTKPAPATALAATPSTVQFTLPLAPSATQAAPSAPPPVVTEVSKPADRAKPSVHMVTIIENLRVTGIRAAGDDSKVLMNDRVYRLNDIVDHDLGLRLTGVSAKSLTFEDEHGSVYTRNF